MKQNRNNSIQPKLNYLHITILILLNFSLVVTAQTATGGKGRVAPDIPDLKTCENLLRNNDFENGLAGWKVVNFTPGAATEIIKQDRNAYIRLSHAGARDWNAIGQEIKSKLEINETYVFSFRYKITSNLTVGIRFGDSSIVMHSSALNDKYGWNRLIIGDENWREDTFEFTASETHPKSNEPIFNICFEYYNVGDILIDDVILAPKTRACHAR